jgi:hypothetical protein
LPTHPDVASSVLRRVAEDHDRLARDGLPDPIEPYLLETYGVDVRASYAGLPLKNPWGVASGQLSMRRAQVEAAADAGVGLVVLKTVIAQDAGGGRSMAAWAVRESRMVVEPIVGRASGVRGWTVTWKGRGWWDSFEAYLDLVREAAAVGAARGVVVAPSVKYHLPGQGDETWLVEEYVETTRRIVAAYRASGAVGPVPLEKDFSPTLAGSDLSRRREMIVDWLDRVPGLIRGAVEAGAIRVGLKMFNSLEDDAFQVAMLEQVHGPARPDFLVYANRLFDPQRVFQGQKGVAYGGPDLSDRNLRVLSMFRSARRAGPPLEVSGTGDVHSGRLAVEYALRGCRSVQIHTLFQLPAGQFAMKRGEKMARALHRLYFDPGEGLIVWLRHAAARLGLVDGGVVRWLDVARAGEESELQAVDVDTQATQV